MFMHMLKFSGKLTHTDYKVSLAPKFHLTLTVIYRLDFIPIEQF